MNTILLIIPKSEAITRIAVAILVYIPGGPKNGEVKDVPLERVAHQAKLNLGIVRVLADSKLLAQRIGAKRTSVLKGKTQKDQGAIRVVGWDNEE
jgi:ABC-type microcin C transport system permease subunit YejB